MPQKRKQLEGRHFGKLTVVQRIRTADGKGAWQCSCECGGTRIATTGHLERGQATSCGCARERHGRKGSRAYSIWQGMRDRCSREKHKDWQAYGGRGIAVCARWNDSFTAFLEDMGEPPAGATIERIDNDRGYEPGNCEWRGRVDQARNRRNSILLAHNGREQCLSAWAEELGVSYWRLHGRYKRGWSAERILAP